jgi:hypothetical protein
MVRNCSFLRFERAGKDADEMFEDIGHSSEARTKMKEYLIGTLKVLNTASRCCVLCADATKTLASNASINLPLLRVCTV